MSPPNPMLGLSDRQRRRLFEQQRSHLKQSLSPDLDDADWQQLESNLRQAMGVPAGPVDDSQSRVASDTPHQEGSQTQLRADEPRDLDPQTSGERPAPNAAATESDDAKPRSSAATSDDNPASSPSDSDDSFAYDEPPQGNDPAGDDLADVRPPDPPLRWNSDTGRWEVPNEGPAGGWTPVPAPPLEPAQWNPATGEWEPCSDSSELVCLNPEDYRQPGEDDPRAQPDEGKDADPQECGLACTAIAWGYAVGSWAAGMWGTIKNAIAGIDWHETAHTAADLGGMAPDPYGTAIDVSHAAWYFAEGRKLDGFLSLFSAIPGLGLGGPFLRWAMKLRGLKFFEHLSSIRRMLDGAAKFAEHLPAGKFRSMLEQGLKAAEEFIQKKTFREAVHALKKLPIDVDPAKTVLFTGGGGVAKQAAKEYAEKIGSKLVADTKAGKWLAEHIELMKKAGQLTPKQEFGLWRNLSARLARQATGEVKIIMRSPVNAIGRNVFFDAELPTLLHNKNVTKLVLDLNGKTIILERPFPSSKLLEHWLRRGKVVP